MGKNTLFYVTLLFCLVFVLACGGDDDDPKIPDTPSADPPEITNVDPNEGEVGDEVDIIGENFSSTPSENTVKFGSIDATVNNATSTKLDVTVPDGAETAKITVTVNNQTATSENEFVVNDPSPKILSFTPMEGGPGTEVTISGIGLEANYESDNYNISFSGNGAEPEVLSVSDSELVVVVPGSLTTGPISIYLNGETIVSEDDFTPTAWTRRKDFPGKGREFGLVTAIGDKVYAGLGMGEDEDAYRDLFEYDPTTNSWTEKTAFPFEIGGRFGFFYFVIEDELFIGGGTDSEQEQVYTDFWKYDADSNTWTQLNDIEDPQSGRLFANTFVIGDKGYVLGGSDVGDSIIHDDFWVYNPTDDSWEQKEIFDGTPISGATAFSINGMGYVVMGCHYEFEDCQKSVWEYNPNNNDWFQKSNFPGEYGRFGAISFSINGLGYVGLGYNNGQAYNDLWEFDPINDSWIKKSDFPSEKNMRYGAGAVTVLNSEAYIGLGFYDGIGDLNEGYPVDFWEYHPEYDKE